LAGGATKKNPPTILSVLSELALDPLDDVASVSTAQFQMTGFFLNILGYFRVSAEELVSVHAILTAKISIVVCQFTPLFQASEKCPKLKCLVGEGVFLY